VRREVGRRRHLTCGQITALGAQECNTRGMRRIAGVTLIVSALVLTGCKGLSVGTGTGTPQPRDASATASAPGASPRAGAGLLSVHDPKVVTYSRTVTTCHAQSGPRPDPSCTPGAIDPAVTQADIHSTICVSGYTAKVRPPTSLTEKAKKSLYTAYGIPTGTTSELDHLVSLELGGSNDVTNLWPEVGKLPNPKDKVENTLHDAVCSGKVTLAAAQQAIASDWETAESVLGLS